MPIPGVEGSIIFPPKVDVLDLTCDLSYGGVDQLWKAISHIIDEEAAVMSQTHHRRLRSQGSPPVAGEVAP